MIRVSHYLPVQQVKSLRALSRKMGVSVAELIRRAVEAYLKSQK